MTAAPIPRSTRPRVGCTRVASTLAPSTLAASTLVGCTLAGCILFGCTASPPPGATIAGPTAGRRSAIAFGAADTTHTAVVAVLAPVGTTELQECTGTIVQVQNGNGYVLTAAHCCNTFVPTVVVLSESYAVGEEFVFGGTPTAPTYPVIASSVYYDGLYDGTDHDFCMLQFSGATASTPTIALPSPTGDGLELGAAVEHIGFGQTQTSTTNTLRRTGTDTINEALTPLIIAFGQGGADDVAGTCEGDSGGPSLFPAGVAQSQQVVVAVQSFGNASSCAAETLGVGSRVTSEIGPGAFITGYLANMPVGVAMGPEAGAPSPDAGDVSADAGAPPPPEAPAGSGWMVAAMAAVLMGVGGTQSRTGRWRSTHGVGTRSPRRRAAT